MSRGCISILKLHFSLRTMYHGPHGCSRACIDRQWPPAPASRAGGTLNSLSHFEIFTSFITQPNTQIIAYEGWSRGPNLYISVERLAWVSWLISDYEEANGSTEHIFTMVSNFLPLSPCHACRHYNRVTAQVLSRTSSREQVGCWTLCSYDYLFGGVVGRWLE